MTNLDKIRNMPAEDFAEYIINFNRCSKCVHYNKEEFECGYLETPIPCIDGVTKWLEQESNPMPKLEIGDIVEISPSGVIPAKRYIILPNDVAILVNDFSRPQPAERITLKMLPASLCRMVYRYFQDEGYKEIWRADNGN